MKNSISIFLMAGGLLLASNLVPTKAGLRPVEPVKPRLVGEVYPDDKPNVWLGGAYFPGKGYRTDVQSKWALYPGVRWQLFGLEGAGPQLASDKGEKNDVPVGYVAQLRGDVAGGGSVKPMIAVSNATPADQPRLPQMQSLDQETYQRVVAGLLRTKGLKIERARLTRVMRVDLNGDGVEEVLMAASSRPDYGRTPEEKKGDYSMLAIRYLDRGAVRARILDYNVSKRDLIFSAPGYFDFIACVDVDGDGAMEIVGSNGYYEGDGFEVWKFDGKSVKSVMSAGWGV